MGLLTQGLKQSLRSPLKTAPKKTQLTRDQKIAAELAKRAQAGDPVAVAGVKQRILKTRSIDPQKTQVASDKAFYEPSTQAQQLKKEYQKEQGLPTHRPPQIKEVDVEKAKRIADAFDAMKHDPKNPEVKRAYNALAEESSAQYQKLLDSGVKFEYWRGRGEPYKSSKEMADDVKNNG